MSKWRLTIEIDTGQYYDDPRRHGSDGATEFVKDTALDMLTNQNNRDYFDIIEIKSIERLER